MKKQRKKRKEEARPQEASPPAEPAVSSGPPLVSEGQSSAPQALVSHAGL